MNTVLDETAPEIPQNISHSVALTHKLGNIIDKPRVTFKQEYWQDYGKFGEVIDIVECSGGSIHSSGPQSQCDADYKIIPENRNYHFIFICSLYEDQYFERTI
ncbi:hypothetical protein A2191_05160 [Candidatus Woesebacteria bacterium RIFOXYA1_FULL_38_9]|nr:MAG: hypothetical protein A2191_05160 [Candidatus Woesebacteria bacterium RIFOXYA1_FULL_38_9]